MKEKGGYLSISFPHSNGGSKRKERGEKKPPLSQSLISSPRVSTMCVEGGRKERKVILLLLLLLVNEGALSVHSAFPSGDGLATSQRREEKKKGLFTSFYAF